MSIRKLILSTLNKLSDYFFALKTVLSNQLTEKGIKDITIEINPGEDTLKTLTTPAILVRCGELPEAPLNSSEGENAERLSLELWCVLSNQVPDVRTEIINFASLIKRICKGQRWGLAGAASAPLMIEATEGDFKEGMAGYTAWQVSFLQTVYMDEAIFSETEYPVNQVWFGVNPADDTDYELIGDFVSE